MQVHVCNTSYVLFYVRRSVHQKITYDDYLPALLGHALPPYVFTSYTTPNIQNKPPLATTEYVTVTSRVVDSMAPDYIAFLHDNGSAITRATPLNPKMRVVRMLGIGCLGAYLLSCNQQQPALQPVVIMMPYCWRRCSLQTLPIENSMYSTPLLTDPLYGGIDAVIK